MPVKVKTRCGYAMRCMYFFLCGGKPRLCGVEYCLLNTLKHESEDLNGTLLQPINSCIVAFLQAVNMLFAKLLTVVRYVCTPKE